MSAILTIGHFNWDSIIRPKSKNLVPGGALYYGLTAAAILKTQETQLKAILKIAKEDLKYLEELKNAGVQLKILPVIKSHQFKVVYPSENDNKKRAITQLINPGEYKFQDINEELKGIDLIILAGNTNKEFPHNLIEEIKKKKGRAKLAIDIQSILRDIDNTGKVSLIVPKEIKPGLNGVDYLKLDDSETEILLNEKNMEKASLKLLQDYGCKEVVITSSKDNGIYARSLDSFHFAPFTNSINIGRNGRGDTSFFVYLLKRTEGSSLKDSLKYSAETVSLKMEKYPGAFNGTAEEVKQRLKN